MLIKTKHKRKVAISKISQDMFPRAKNIVYQSNLLKKKYQLIKHAASVNGARCLDFFNVCVMCIYFINCYSG